MKKLIYLLVGGVVGAGVALSAVYFAGVPIGAVSKGVDGAVSPKTLLRANSILANGAASSSEQSILLIRPPEASSLPAVEIADLVVAAIPKSGFELLDWGYMIDSPFVHWKTNGFEDSADKATRVGLVRVTVDGKTSTVLREKREELAWSITLGTNGNPKFGPKWIHIEAGALEYCFGTLYEGCTFTAAQALNSPFLEKKLICTLSGLGDKTEVYQVNEPGKTSALVVWEMDEGSGGATTSLEVRPLSDRPSLCTKKAP